MTDESITELLPSFEHYLNTSTELAPRSREIYVNAVRMVAQEMGNPGLSDLTPQLLLDWHSDCLKRGLRDQTIASRRHGLRHFLIWVDEVLEDPQGARLLRTLRRMKTPRESKAPYREPFIIDDETFGKLLGGASIGYFGARDRAMLHLLWDTGVRRAELVSIKLADVDLLRRTVFVTGKGDKKRLVSFTRACQQDLLAWLQARQVWSDPADTLFVNHDGHEFNPNTLNRMLKEWARRAKVKQDLWPHLFRHTRVTHLVKEMGLHYAARYAGHSNINTTQGYFHEDPAELQAGYDQAMGEEEEPVDGQDAKEET